jgi:hypothetical protein
MEHMVDHIHLDNYIFNILFLLRNIMRCFNIYSSFYSDCVHIEINKLKLISQIARGDFKLLIYLYNTSIRFLRMIQMVFRLIPLLSLKWLSFLFIKLIHEKFSGDISGLPTPIQVHWTRIPTKLSYNLIIPKMAISSYHKWDKCIRKINRSLLDLNFLLHHSWLKTRLDIRQIHQELLWNLS